MRKTTSTITPRQAEILRRLAASASKATIASELGVSVNTVSAHVRKLYIRLRVHTAAEAVMRGAELQLLDK
jgi:DNA-binding CsgD family transcriptional regulator